MEKRLESNLIYDGKIIKVRRDKVLLESGKEALRELVEHPGGVAMALEDVDGNFFLVSQFRYGVQRTLLEFPAGKREANEDILEGVKREIIEEIGYTAKDIIYLGEMVPTGAYLGEIIHMYYGKVDKFVGENPDEDEILHIEKDSLENIIKKIENNEIIDAKTIVMAYRIRDIKSRL